MRRSLESGPVPSPRMGKDVRRRMVWETARHIDLAVEGLCRDGACEDETDANDPESGRYAVARAIYMRNLTEWVGRNFDLIDGAMQEQFNRL